MVSKYGVEYDLTRTNYIVSWKYLTFHFSTQKNAEKFEKKLNIKIEWLNDSFEKRFKFEIDTSVIAVIQLYNQIEQRGFLIKDNKGGVYTCLENIILHGIKISYQDSIQQQDVITMQSEKRQD